MIASAACGVNSRLPAEKRVRSLPLALHALDLAHWIDYPRSQVSVPRGCNVSACTQYLKMASNSKAAAVVPVFRLMRADKVTKILWYHGPAR